MKVNIALLTVTDTRTFDNDKSGAILVDKIKEANHNLADRKICKDNNLIQPTQHLPNFAFSYIFPNKQYGKHNPIEQEHIFSKQLNSGINL